MIFEVNTGITGDGVGAGGGGASPVAKCWRCAGIPLVKYSTAWGRLKHFVGPLQIDFPSKEMFLHLLASYHLLGSLIKKLVGSQVYEVTCCHSFECCNPDMQAKTATLSGLLKAARKHCLSIWHWANVRETGKHENDSTTQRASRNWRQKFLQNSSCVCIKLKVQLRVECLTSSLGKPMSHRLFIANLGWRIKALIPLIPMTTWNCSRNNVIPSS